MAKHVDLWEEEIEDKGNFAIPFISCKGLCILTWTGCLHFDIKGKLVGKEGKGGGQ